MGRWSSPEHEAMPGVCKTRLNGRIVDSFEDGVNYQSRKVRGEKLGLLLAIASCAVSSIASLDDGLWR